MNKRDLTSDISFGGQPTASDVEQLKKAGFRSVINLRRNDEESPLSPMEEEKVVREQRMEYQHIPVSSQNLGAVQADQFARAMLEVPKPVYVHCQGGTRAGAFSLLHLAREAGWSGEEAFAEGEKAGYKCESPALREFVNKTLGAPSGRDRTG